MAAPALVARMTADEFYRNPDVPDRAELVDGEVVLMAPPSTKHSWVVRAIFRALDTHVTARALGEVFGDGMGYELPPGPDTVRIPDVSFVRAERVPRPLPEHGTWRLAPDLAVAVLSDSDTRAVVRKKLADYFGGGTPLVWLVDVDARGIEVWMPDAVSRWVGEDEVLDGGAVLPDFTVPVRDLFAGVARGG